jgi:protoheme IX farnesyltransferase
MSSQHLVTEQLVPSGSQGGRFARSTVSDYWALTKPEVNFLILITTGVGFYLGCANEARPLPFGGLLNTLLGTLLVASGTGTLNQYLERKFDAQMRRTMRRPAAAGRLKPAAVLAFGIALAGAGSVYLAAAVNPRATVLAALTMLAYLFAYTPLKRKTPLCVLVGAFPGAMPPLIGWAGTSSRLSIEAGILYAIVFLWQFPHFMAIAWMYREDYDRAGYLVLPKGNARIPFVTLETLFPLLALFAISMVQFPTRHAAVFYCAGALLSLGFLYFGLQFVLWRSRATARRLLAASIVYLPLLFALSATLCNQPGADPISPWWHGGNKFFVPAQNVLAPASRVVGVLNQLLNTNNRRSTSGKSLCPSQ